MASMDTTLSLVLLLGTICFIIHGNGFSPFCLAQEESYQEVECVLPHFFLCSNGNCIPESLLCDSEIDCGSDGSDEDPEYCANLTCNATSEFKCASGRCIAKEGRCDRKIDCRDHSDESGCVYSPCPADKFACANNSQCLDMAQVCDGHPDCFGEPLDETHDEPCPSNVTCPPYAFKCTGTNVCALPNLMCDGVNNCGDNSDELEQNCKNFQCPETWFKCSDERCIPESAVCNGVIDCSNDERHPSPCPNNVTCPEGYFSCQDTNICAHPHWLCDGSNDCGDNSTATQPSSDENPETCAKTPCPEEWFRCKNNRCIPPNWRCDGSADCMAGEDEDGCEAYYNALFLTENSTLAAALNSSELDDGDSAEPPLTPPEGGQPAPLGASKPKAISPIFSYVNSQTTPSPKSNRPN